MCVISMLSVLVKAYDMSCAEAGKALAPRVWGLKPETSSPCIKCVTSGIQACPVSSSDILSSLLWLVQTCHNVSSVTQTRSCTN